MPRQDDAGWRGGLGGGQTGPWDKSQERHHSTLELLSTSAVFLPTFLSLKVPYSRLDNTPRPMWAQGIPK